MSARYLPTILVALAWVLLAGCGNPSTEMTGGVDSSVAEYNIPAVENGATGEPSPALLNAEASQSTDSVAIDNRKIIYDSTIGLVVDDYRQFESKLPALVGKHGGFVANSNTDRRYNDQQSGTWVVRIPVAEYSAFLSGVNSLGFAETRRENAQDVSEEYVDVEARIKNKRALEQRIITMLEERTGKLADILEIERELSRVREEIERMEGRLRFLKDRTSLATVTIICREQKEYTPAEAPNLASRARYAWDNSTGSLRVTAESLLLASIALAPWLMVLAVPCLLVWIWVKRSRSRRKSQASKT